MPADELTLAALRARIPGHCFEIQPKRALAYLGFDLFLIMASYGAMMVCPVWYVQLPLVGLIGTLLWALFVLGHDAGHGVFFKGRLANTVAGILLHGALLVPYRAWQRSHARHHAWTGHLEREEVFRACHPGQTGWLYALFFRSGLFLLLGWPLYKLGLRNIGCASLTRHSHFLPGSDLMCTAFRGSWWASLAVVLTALCVYGGIGLVFGPGVFLVYIVGPYLIYSTWLTLTTWLHHVSEEVPVYDAAHWTPVKGALCTVDRDYGLFGWLTHNTGPYHVVHHLFPRIPHYHLRAATEAIAPVLGPFYLTSKRFIVFDLIRSLQKCQIVVPGKGCFVYRPARREASSREARR